MNLKSVLMQLGNRLVTEVGYDPSGPLPQSVMDRLAAEWNTEIITLFTAWLNQHSEAVHILEEMGVEWPLANRMSGSNGGGNGGTRHVQLGDLISDKAARKLTPILNKLRHGKIDDIEAKKLIVQVLEPERAELLAKGYVLEYLAYFLIANMA